MGRLIVSVGRPPSHHQPGALDVYEQRSPNMGEDEKEPQTPIDSAPQSPIGHDLGSTVSKSTARSSAELFKFYPTITEKPVVQEKAIRSSPGGPLDPRTNAKPRPPWWRQWMVEITLSISSLGAFIIIVAVLASYNDRPLPRLPMQITLNTFLAFFTTFTKAAFMIPISEAISQWKWNIYASGLPGRPLADFQILDAASRGVWGSWMLFRNFKWNHFVSFAAILSTLSLFTSPITQQMISYSIRPTPDPLGKASLQFSQNVHYTDTIPDWIRRSNLATLGSRADSPVQPLPATCTTTKCTFPQYTSLAVCMKMVDISQHLTVTPVQIPAEMRAQGNTSTLSSWSMGSDWLPAVKEGNRTNPESTPAWNASLPNGMSYITPLSYAAITWPFGGSMKDSIAFANNSDDKFTALANFFHIYSAAGNVSYPGYERKADDPPWEFHAFEILYYMCVNTYETVYEAGTSTTKIVASSNIPFRGTLPDTSTPPSSKSKSNSTTIKQEDNRNLPTYNAGCYFPPGLENDKSEGDICEHIEKPGTFTALSSPGNPSKPYIMDRYVGATITGELFYKARNTYVGDGVPTHRGVSSGAGADAVKEALWGPAQRGNFSRQQTEDRLRAFMNGFATSLSNGLRTASGDAQILEGVSWSPETFIHINWGWIGFLAAQMGFSYIFLAVTILKTRRLGVPVLKSSEIATLLAGTDEVRRVVGGLGDLDGAERMARGTRVVLKLGEDFSEDGAAGKGTGTSSGSARFVVVNDGRKE